MEQFWEGFEKRALSSALLRRASDAARIKATAAAALHDVKLYGKRMKQHIKFHSVALNKDIAREQQKWNEDFIKRMKDQGQPNPEKLLKDKGIL